MNIHHGWKEQGLRLVSVEGEDNLPVGSGSGHGGSAWEVTCNKYIIIKWPNRKYELNGVIYLYHRVVLGNIWLIQNRNNKISDSNVISNSNKISFLSCNGSSLHTNSSWGWRKLFIVLYGIFQWETNKWKPNYNRENHNPIFIPFVGYPYRYSPSLSEGCSWKELSHFNTWENTREYVPSA